MPDVQSILQTNDAEVRKWASLLFFLMDPAVPAPTQEDFWGADYLPIVPAGALQLGYITTDGISDSTEISAEDTTMLQKLQPVRNDMTGLVQTLAVSFGESNAYTQALRHAVPFEDFPIEKDGPWHFDQEITEFPEYRGGFIGQDGVGSQAVYRVEFGYRIKVVGMEGRTLNRTNPEVHGFTFGLFPDIVTGQPSYRGQDAPRYHPVAP
ncbi:MAG: hypothetical protein QJR09_11875 [Micrococcus sp.]|nr:hypothetical protein [Micrococcus sp.]